MQTERKKHVAVCGGGLVGALCACYLAQRGFKVDVYERRSDIRAQEIVKGRSINLAISHRGLEALNVVGLEEAVKKIGIPMHARMIHDLDGKRHSIPYGTKDQYIMAISRRLLNEILLSAAEEYDDVKLYFEHKLISCDFNSGEITLLNNKGDKVRSNVDLIVGTDGAFSAVRKEMMKLSCFDYQQEYIPHGYMEFNVPPNRDNQYAMELNYLHIWPRNEFMMIALPNLDKTFTINLFMPFDMFDAIKTKEDVLKFFKEMFPDSIPLVGEKELIDTFLSSKGLPMISIKCNPHHVINRAVILGDAAHAIVPFYGQGMNCGFEDLIVFNEILDKFNNDFDKALPEYTRMRSIDAKAICDLAMYNYIEMRSSVNSKLFLVRKKLDNFLFWLFPKTWVPLYTMVSFTRIRYHECIAKRKWQDKIISRCVRASFLLTGCFFAGIAYSVQKGKLQIQLPLPTEDCWAFKHDLQKIH